MRINTKWTFGVVSLLSLAACGGGKPNHETALGCVRSVIIGDIRPAPGEFAKAISITEDRIDSVYAGIDEIPKFKPECMTELAPGAVAFAGLTDGHAHLLGIGLRELTLNLEGTSSVAELKERIAVAAKNEVNAKVLSGGGWIETGWPEGRMPNAADLDAVVSDRPVILSRADGHAVVVNSAALAAAGIDAETADPVSGRIVRDADGAATGILIDAAIGLVRPLIPALDKEQILEGVRVGAEVYAEKGWTGIHNMSVDQLQGEAIRELAAAGELPLRVWNYYTPAAEILDDAGNRSCSDDGMVCEMGAKFYVDGSLGSRGALLFEEYADEPGTRGLQLISAVDAKEQMSDLLSKGYQVTTHAIGDKGNETVLSWYSELTESVDDHRWRIEHAQIVRPQDIERFANGAVIASMQPSHAIGDLFFAPDRLGDTRLDGAYAWQSMIDAGVRVVGGSDAPVEQGDPRIELHAASRRTSLDGFFGENWRMQEALSPGDAVAMFTTEAAFAVFREHDLGRLAPGYLADITVFSADPFTVQWDEIEVVGTYIGGQLMK